MLSLKSLLRLAYESNSQSNALLVDAPSTRPHNRFIYLMFNICFATKDTTTEPGNHMSIFHTTSSKTCEKIECPPLNISLKAGSAECSNGQQVESICEYV